MTEIKQIEEKLKAPFPAEDIEYRVVRVRKESRQALVLPYITSRAVMDRLDEVFGCDGWQDEYEVLPSGVACRLSAKLNGDFITKQDAAPYTHIEALKGAFSDALKRAAVKFGIGRYLYKLPENYVNILPQRPTKAKGKVRYYHSKEICGWWLEPSVLSATQNKSETPSRHSEHEDTAEFKALSLTQKLKRLGELGIITDKKRANYEAKLQDRRTAPGLLSYFNKQFELLYSLYCLAKNNKVSAATKASIYKRIMSSRLQGFIAIENKMKELEAA
jgi:hypothetical protein